MSLSKRPKESEDSLIIGQSKQAGVNDDRLTYKFALGQTGFNYLPSGSVNDERLTYKFALTQTDSNYLPSGSVNFSSLNSVKLRNTVNDLKLTTLTYKFVPISKDKVKVMISSQLTDQSIDITLCPLCLKNKIDPNDNHKVENFRSVCQSCNLSRGAIYMKSRELIENSHIHG